uniref:Uncharacterized protein n=1 Tax=Anopheles culicifacies TaxID=139723 RepID=A0A182LYW0_9DIPT
MLTVMVRSLVLKVTIVMAVGTCWPLPALGLAGMLLPSAYLPDDERGTHRCRIIEPLVTLRYRRVFLTTTYRFRYNCYEKPGRAMLRPFDTLCAWWSRNLQARTQRLSAPSPVLFRAVHALLREETEWRIYMPGAHTYGNITTTTRAVRLHAVRWTHTTLGLLRRDCAAWPKSANDHVHTDVGQCFAPSVCTNVRNDDNKRNQTSNMTNQTA